MTRNNLLVFITFLFNSLTKTIEVDYTDNVSQELLVSHYDCTKMQDNRIYSLNKVAECKISPENLYIAPATITLYQKNYRTGLSATMCSVKVHVFRYNCGMLSHTSYVHDQNSITYDMIVTPEMCRLTSKSKKIKITAFDENFDVPIEFDTKTQSNFNDGQAVSSTIECTSGQIKHYTFETLMQRVNLTYNYGTKAVSNKDRKKTSMSFNGGWLRDHYSRFICTYLGHSRKLCDDKNSHTRCKNAALSLDNGSKGKSILLP